jgi:biopolymer transport protein ExbB
MMVFIDNFIPWLGGLLMLGGDILVLILVMAFLMWSLLFERIYYLYIVHPQHLRRAVRLWEAREDKLSWYAMQYREHLRHRINSDLDRGFPLIGTIIKICPLLGLLGTVAGMLEVFDALAATGANNPRSMAAGVSKATVSTLAGMVVAIFGLLGSKFIERRALAEREALPAQLAYLGAGGDA